MRDLERLLPLLRHAEPLAYFEVLNAYAVELLANTRLSEAQNVLAITVSSPFLAFYPELQETLLQARSQLKQRSAAAISLPEIEQYEPRSAEPINNVIQFPVEESVPEPRVQIAINFMSAKLERRISLRELAGVVNLSPSHLSYLFKSETGLSPGNISEHSEWKKLASF